MHSAGAGHEHVSRAQPSGAARLQNRNNSADCQRREYGPRQVIFPLVSGPDDNDHKHDSVCKAKHYALYGDAKRKEKWAPLLRLVANVLVYLCYLSASCSCCTELPSKGVE